MRGQYILGGPNGKTPIHEPDMHKWGIWFSKADRTVAKTEIPGFARVSTVFLGLDHNHSDYGPPLLFETMVFAEQDWDEQSMWRYATWEEAERHHHQIVQELHRRHEIAEAAAARSLAEIKKK